MVIANPSGTRAFFARRLRELRIPRGYKTARKLALELGIDENRYTRYERAEVEPDLELVVRIAEVLDVTPNDLLGVFSQLRYPAGFEDGAPSGAGKDSAANAVQDYSVERSVSRESSSAGGRGGLQRNAAMWSLAREIVLAVDDQKLNAYFGHDGWIGRSSGQVQRIAQLYKMIDADAFGFVSEFSLSPLLAELTAEQQERVTKLIERVTGAEAH